MVILNRASPRKKIEPLGLEARIKALLSRLARRQIASFWSIIFVCARPID